MFRKQRGQNSSLSVLKENIVFRKYFPFIRHLTFDICEKHFHFSQYNGGSI